MKLPLKQRTFSLEEERFVAGGVGNWRTVRFDVGEVDIVMGLMMPSESAVEARRKIDQKCKNVYMVAMSTPCGAQLE